MYFYINKEFIKRIAARISDISFDIDFFEYSERRGYTTNDNTIVRPEFEKGTEKREEGTNCFNRNKVGVSGEKGVLRNLEIVKRYINIEDVSDIKNNKFYYNILENVSEDERLRKIVGIIEKIEDDEFIINGDKFIIDKKECTELEEIYANNCEVNVLGYKINCLNLDKNIFKVIAIYIE